MPATSRALDLELLRRRCSGCSLRELCLPAGLDASDIELIEQGVTASDQIPAGQALYHAGAPFDALYVIKSGSLKTFANSEGGELQILGFHLPGEVIGFDALAGYRHQCTAEALEPTRACRLPYANLERLAARVPGLQRQLMRLISREMQDDHRHLAMMGRPQALGRLALFLYSLSQRQQRLGRRPDHLTLSMSRADLANYLGLVLETVSRLFGRLQEMGVLDVRRREVTILDPERLRELSNE
ncbi:MAG: helix-turn-helix domain-containing protein [Pseudomonadota bacterium]|nr:MAG: helix-turn-helix domain-containing protein [Pseudomonadota bacterium]